MQTFLPYPHFRRSAKVLDRARLGKQRVEAWQILQTLIGQSSGWANHPAVAMWRGHEIALAFYGYTMCDEWLGRGYKDSLLDRFREYLNSNNRPVVYPPWFGDPGFHQSHRANLARKDPVHYARFRFKHPERYPYVWPR